MEYAILETSGQISVILKSEKRTVTPEDLNLKVEPTNISYDLIVDGKIMYDNLMKLGKDKKWLEDEALKLNFIPSQALIFVLNGDGTFFYQTKIKK